MPRGQPDIANTALRIFLQEIGAAYDEARGQRPYGSRGDFAELLALFDDRCCYCGTAFSSANRAVQDHLVPMNRTSLGLHSWGNIVPACADCNAKKQGGDWQAFIIQRAGADAAERHSKVLEMRSHYAYAPALTIADIAAELYDEVGSISMTLINAKIKRVRTQMQP